MRRLIRFGVEVVFLLALAGALVLAEAEPALIAGAMLAGWLVVVLFEWAGMRSRPHYGRGLPPRYYVPQVSLPPPRPLEQLPAFPTSSDRDDEATWIAPPELRAAALEDWTAASATAPPPAVSEDTMVDELLPITLYEHRPDPWLYGPLFEVAEEPGTAVDEEEPEEEPAAEAEPVAPPVEEAPAVVEPPATAEEEEEPAVAEAEPVAPPVEEAPAVVEPPATEEEEPAVEEPAVAAVVAREIVDSEVVVDGTAVEAVEVDEAVVVAGAVATALPAPALHRLDPLADPAPRRRLTRRAADSGVVVEVPARPERPRALPGSARRERNE